MKQAQYWYNKLLRRAKQLACSRLYVNPDPDPCRSILVAGAARSGTTWLGDLIAAQVPCRTLFEPFNPELVPEYRAFRYFQYMRPGADHPALAAFARKVFTGEIRGRWIDRQNERIFASRRLIKEIRANLLLRWLHEQFPEVPVLFIVRHPCAVVLSRMQLGWATDRDIQPFLEQADLVADYLAPYLDLIHSCQTYEEKHAVIWCVSNLVPLRQFVPGELKIVYYENLIAQPEQELPVIFSSIQLSYNRSMSAKVKRPSQTTTPASAVVTGDNPVEQWKRKLSPDQVERILRVVRGFGLDHLYGDSFLPLCGEGAVYVR